MVLMVVAGDDSATGNLLTGRKIRENFIDLLVRGVANDDEIQSKGKSIIAGKDAKYRATL